MAKKRIPAEEKKEYKGGKYMGGPAEEKADKKKGKRMAMGGLSFGKGPGQGGAPYSNGLNGMKRPMSRGPRPPSTGGGYPPYRGGGRGFEGNPAPMPNPITGGNPAPMPNPITVGEPSPAPMPNKITNLGGGMSGGRGPANNSGYDTGMYQSPAPSTSSPGVVSTKLDSSGTANYWTPDKMAGATGLRGGGLAKKGVGQALAKGGLVKGAGCVQRGINKPKYR